MKQKEGKMLRYRLGVSVLILIILSTGFISAADVIVKPGDLYVEGKVGIGTESPGAKLEIAQANAHPGLYINATTAAYNPHIRLYQASSAYDGEIGVNAATGHIYIGDVGTATGVLNVDLVNDRVGIGTVSPTSELEIASSAPDLELQDTTDNQNAVIAYDADKLNFWAGGTNIMTLLETGNVGIGTTSPNNLLNVGGGGVAGYDVSIATDLYVGTTIYSGNFVSAVTYIDRTPYPSSLQEAYDALMSVESKITTNGTIIDKSKLNPILLHIDEKTGEKGRDLSMTVSVLTEVVKDLKKQNDALTQALCEIKPDPELCK